MKKLMQFCYSNDKNRAKRPSYLTKNWLTGLNIFERYGAVCQLGIQGPVGLRFYLNGNPNPIQIGQTGIYELELNEARITSIRFNLDDIENLTGMLLIDIVYEEDN